jgi:hypothetical protein
VTAFGKLIRTTAFRLTLVYLFLFALFAASLLGYFAWNTAHDHRADHRHRQLRIKRAIQSICEGWPARACRRGRGRALRPGANLYLVTTGRASQVMSPLEPGVMDHPGWAETFISGLKKRTPKVTTRW